MPKTKIICTLGPASANHSIIRRMMLAGMDVARLNFSHGKQEEHQRALAFIRKINKKYRRHVTILQDLEGHRIRVRQLKNHQPVTLKKHQFISVTTEDVPGDERIISIDYPGSLLPIRKGQQIFIDDGNIALTVKTTGKIKLLAEVTIPNELKEHKGVNIPGAALTFDGLTLKDREDIEFGIRNGVDFIAQSFVRNRHDILLVRERIKTRLPGCRIIAKIESREGIENLNEILKVSDGIMVARGDMGISLPVYEVPVIQKRIIKKCNEAGKPVITATQMLESMVYNPTPTRAEVSDVANAVFDGTNYVMLSAETAVGEYPVETVRMMNQVIIFSEGSTKTAPGLTN